MSQKIVRGKKVLGCQIGGGLLRMESLGEVFLNNDGTVELHPIELLPLEDGRVIFRIGRTIYTFGKDGEYEGAEMHVLSADPLYQDSIRKLMDQAKRNFGKSPESYFGG